MGKLKKKTGDLSKADIDKLGETLHGTTQNVYTLVRSRFGFDAGDEIFGRLEKEAGIFRCEECSTWHVAKEERSGVGDICNSCLDEIDGDQDI